MPIEHITLQPHPLDAWRRALDILIACAPGHPADVGNHLRDAAMGMGAKPSLSEQETRLVQRLLIAADVAMHQAGSRSLERKVSSRLTVMVEGTDYDVSGMPGVLVGDVIRVDLDNMPPVLNRNAIGRGFQGRLDPFAPIRLPTPSSPDAPARPADARPTETSVSPASAPRCPAPVAPGGEPVEPMHTSSQPGGPEAHRYSDDPA